MKTKVTKNKKNTMSQMMSKNNYSKIVRDKFHVGTSYADEVDGLENYILKVISRSGDFLVCERSSYWPGSGDKPFKYKDTTRLRISKRLSIEWGCEVAKNRFYKISANHKSYV